MKNKIHKYDFLIVGAGLIGAITALALIQKKFKVLVIDKKNNISKDNRTLAVNANSIDFLKKLGVWNALKFNPQPIDKIVIKDDISKQPLIFSNQQESMGNVIFNKDMYEIARNKLINLGILKNVINYEIDDVLPDRIVYIEKEKYLFKKIIISIGKNIIFNKKYKGLKFNQQHYSYVGFVRHANDHKNTAYEFFTQDGPLAVLPSPADNKKKSTFIYSSKEKINSTQLQKLINKKIADSHGKLTINRLISKFPITPHLIGKNEKYIYVGDSLKSIHPVAGQGWNLGVKDIQTLCKLLDQYSIEDKKFNSIFYSRRMIESSIYLSFTSILNFLYENQISLNKDIIKLGYNILKNFKFLRDIFIKQAMGRFNLTD